MNSDHPTSAASTEATNPLVAEMPHEEHLHRHLRSARYIGALCLCVAAGLAAGAAVGSRGDLQSPVEQELPPTPELSSNTDLIESRDITAATPPSEVLVDDLAALGKELAPAPEFDDPDFQNFVAEPIIPAPQEEVRVLTVSKGDTLMEMLAGEGIDRKTAYNAIQAMSEVFSPRKLKIGHELHVTLLPPVEETETEAGPDLLEIRLPETKVKEIQVTKLDDGGYSAKSFEKQTDRHQVRAEGVIKSSLYEAAVDQNVPLPVLGDLIHIFSFDIDFQREVQPGDRFSLMYDTEQLDGSIVSTGAVHMAEMTVGGKLRRYYRFKAEDGFWDYFDEKGRSVRKALLRTPVDGARLSSGYGKRRHPILGYMKMHRGVDFAAPTGTPIFSAGDGVVEAAGWNGGYGKYVRVRHNSTYKTAYAHMSRIKIKKGARVRQGQVIGYVGTTGRSTGPHLHYEVHKNGKQTNPLGVKLPTGKTLAGKDLKKFKTVVANLNDQFAGLQQDNTVATAD